MSQKVTGLASAFEPAKPPQKSGVTTIASRFDTDTQKSEAIQSKVSDLASRFAGSDAPTPVPVAIKKTPSKLKAGSPTIARGDDDTKAEMSRKVSDLSKAFSDLPKGGASPAFTAAQSAFLKRESKVSDMTKSLDAGDASTAGVAGVARSFESRDIASTGSPVPRFQAKAGGEKQKIEDKVEGFASVASRFEAGVAGRKAPGDDTGDAKERFRDAAKMFGGS